ncbi:hypothetical protein [Nocardioides massiliensis]|uniref:Uncharacterized protein n=1 Tax=Nocardioides massiliensis TaxID=1325935 RepID=A0ABT9NKU7_9ACTN|nr:hypothetical protein [Nocardioides massiliensis]MDP9821046.1 hypothetical protein [Nocardioides massiliensis]
MNTPRYPDLTVQLSGHDGNAFAVLGRVARALKSHGVSAAEVQQFNDEAMSGSYDDLLRTCARWVEVQ